MTTAWNLTISKEFWREIVALPQHARTKTSRAVERLAVGNWAGGLHCEKVQQAEEGMYSCRVDDNYRIICKLVPPTEMILCLVDKHDQAYRRAARNSFTLQDGLVKIADILEVGAKVPENKGELHSRNHPADGKVGTLFIGYRDSELVAMGVPPDVLPHVRALEDANQLPDIERLLAPETYDKLVGIALGVVERPKVPDGQLQQSLVRYQGGHDLHRFLDSEEFKHALEGSLEEWMLFLAPDQRQLAMRAFSGPARVKGVVGSGKTVIAIHRARNLARQAHAQGDKILFLTFGNRLPGVVHHLLHHLAGDGAPELEAIECKTVHAWCDQYLRAQDQPLYVPGKAALQQELSAAVTGVQSLLPSLALWAQPLDFFEDEIRYAIKGRALRCLDDYLAVERSGRGTALREADRRAMFAVYEAYQAGMRGRRVHDWDDFPLEAMRVLDADPSPPRYRAAVVDEIQDLTGAILRLVRRLVPPGPDDLFLVGDGLQRLYPGGYALGRLGIDITGRSALLTRNYRNTHEILRAAHAMMLGLRYDDLDDEPSQVQEPELSLRHGPLPTLRGFRRIEDELVWVAEQIQLLKQDFGYSERDLALLYRFRHPYTDLCHRLLGGTCKLIELTNEPDTYFGSGLKHSTFDSAKGLEFKAVFVLGVTDGVFVPKADPTLHELELQDYLERERRRLYVAMTRARDRVYLTYAGGQPSRFLADIPEAFLDRESG